MRSVACIATLLVLAACSSSSTPQRVVTVTRTRAPSAPAGTPSAGASGATTASTSASAPAHLTKLPGTCDSLLPDGDVIAAIGGTELGGVDSFVVGVPEKNIGRIAYLNCRYGLVGRGASAKAKVEIGISLYSTPARAADRASGTVDDFSQHGAKATTTTVQGLPGTVLSGGRGAGYDVPLLVVVDGQRTVAVSIYPALATGAKASSDAVAVAQLALQRTAG